jgi:hypothetical protein
MPDRTVNAYPRTRRCQDCGLSAGMRLQNNALFTAHYICERCGTALTVPPAKLLLPPVINRKDEM